MYYLRQKNVNASSPVFREMEQIEIIYNKHKNCLFDIEYFLKLKSIYIAFSCYQYLYLFIKKLFQIDEVFIKT